LASARKPRAFTQPFLTESLHGTNQQVPGIGPKAAESLASGDDPSEKITNTFQLIGK
jgi:hypothetical protein